MEHEIIIQAVDFIHLTETVHVGTERTTTGGVTTCVADGVRFLIAFPKRDN